MAAADTCCMRGGWDLSFLDTEAAAHLQHLHFARKGDFHRRALKGATTTVPHSPSVNPLGSIVRRCSTSTSASSSRKVSPQQTTMTSASTGATCDSPDELANNSVDDSLDHIYENQTKISGDDVIWSRGLACRAAATSSSSSSSSSSEDDLPASSSSSSFLQTPPSAASVCRSSLSPVAQTSLVFPLQESSSSSSSSSPLALLCSQSQQTSADVYSRITRGLSFWDDDQLATTFRRLSLCRFYLGKLSFDEAKVLLRHHPVGTFLLRDSSDDRFPFALSVQTRRGTTSIRIVCECGGRFRLDCEPEQVHLMPTFDCVIALVQFYVRQGERRGSTPNNLVLQEMNGRKDLPVLLRKAYETGAPSLAHLCRRRINGMMEGKNINRLHLLPSLKDYLGDYPYDV